MRRVGEVIDCWYYSGRDAIRAVGILHTKATCNYQIAVSCRLH